MKTKNIQDVVAAIIRKYDVRYFDGSTYAVNKEFEKDLTQLVKEVEEGERDRIRRKIMRAPSHSLPNVGGALFKTWNDINKALTPPTGDVTEK